MNDEIISGRLRRPLTPTSPTMVISSLVLPGDLWRLLDSGEVVFVEEVSPLGVAQIRRSQGSAPASAARKGSNALLTRRARERSVA